MTRENITDADRDLLETGRASLFDATYYATGCGKPYSRDDYWLRFFGGIADEILRSLHPTRVFDAGCAMGMLVESFWDRGVEAWGVDISPYAIANIRPGMRPYCQVKSITEPFGGRFDLVTCIEVLEHMPEEEARVAVKQITTASDVVLFSSTPDDFDEPTHINVHPIVYWLKLFGEYGFQPDLIYDAGFVAPHAILFRRAQQPWGEDVLLSFSEKVRLKISLVQREQGIEALKEQLAQSEAARSHDREELETEAASARRSAEELETEAASARQRVAELASSESELRGRLQAIVESPAWRVVGRYRYWLRSSRMRNRIVNRWFEPMAARLLRWFTRKGIREEAEQRILAVAPATGCDDERLALEPAAAPTLQYEDWIQLHEPSPGELDFQRRLSAELAWRPKFSIIVPVYQVSRQVLIATVESVLNQTYDHWELCIVDADPAAAANRHYLAALAASDARIKVQFLETNLGIAGNSNRALHLSEGEFVALLDHDDTLAPFALFEMAQLLNEDPSLDFIYSDRDELSEDGARRMDPFFKPGWSPDLLLCVNYLTHLCVLRAAIVREIGGWRSETDGAQDWDLFVRAIAKSPRVAHIPKVLYHWRRVPTSFAARGLDAKPYALDAQLKVVRSHLEAQGSNAQPAFGGDGWFHLEWNSKRRQRPTVVVLSTQTADVAGKYAAAVFPAGRYPNLEIVLVLCAGGDGSAGIRDSRLRVVPYDGNVSLASRLNKAVRQSSSAVLVFLDQSVQAGKETWLDELTAPLEQPGIAITGAKLFDKGTCQILHAGICFNPDGEMTYPFASEADYTCNLFGGVNWYRNWLAVTGACFAIRREVFERVGGFSEEPVYPRLDVDLCLRAGLETGQRVLCNPFAHMWKAGTAVLEKWLRKDWAAAGARHIRSSFPEGDPFFNPNLVSNAGKIGLARFGGGHAFARADHNFAAEARALVKAYDCVPDEIRKSKASCFGKARGAVTNHFMWFIPEFRHAFYGGIYTIFRFADYFRRAHGIRSSFVVLGHAPPKRITERIALVSPELAATSAVEVLGDYGGISRLESSDAAIATHWNTAYYVLRYNQAREKFYFLQDDESLFYPAGSTSALVGATLGFGFKGICNTVTLRDLYTARGGDAEFFAPCVDRDIFYPKAARESDEDRPQTLFCYARPNHPRNCFEIVVEVIRILKRRLGNKVTIVTAGEEWEPADFALDGLVHNPGLLSYRATGALYRSCDAGVIMMSTAHPSYLPLELMACGTLVVTNDNPNTRWLLKNGDNCLLSAATPSALAEAVEEGLFNKALRRQITENAGRMVREEYQDWDRAAEKVFRYMCGSQPIVARHAD